MSDNPRTVSYRTTKKNCRKKYENYKTTELINNEGFQSRFITSVVDENMIKISTPLGEGGSSLQTALSSE